MREDLPKIEPGFDLEEFMNFSHESRISSEALDAMNDLWQKWTGLIRAEKVSAGQDSCLAIWLPAEIEAEIDSAWEKSPSEGFMLNNLAQYLCMAAVAELVPQTIDIGCAPTPRMSKDMEAAAANCGATLDGKLARYAVLTWFPFRGGCEICALSNGCPRMTGGGPDFSGAVLPGYEAGIDD